MGQLLRQSRWLNAVGSPAASTTPRFSFRYLDFQKVAIYDLLRNAALFKTDLGKSGGCVGHKMVMRTVTNRVVSVDMKLKLLHCPATLNILDQMEDLV